MQRSPRSPTARYNPGTRTRVDLLLLVLVALPGMSGCLNPTPPGGAAAASATAAPDAEATQSAPAISPGEPLSAAQRKISSPLLQAIRQRLGPAGASPALETGVQIDAQGGTVVDITAHVSDELLAKLETLGAEILDAVPRFRSIRARVPLDQIEAIAEDANVLSIQPKQEATTNLP